MQDINQITKDANQLIIKHVNDNYGTESEKEAIRKNFIEGLVQGFKFAEDVGIPSEHYWKKHLGSIEEYTKEKTFKIFLQERSQVFGQFLGSLCHALGTKSQLSGTDTFNHILKFLEKNWHDFYQYLKYLI